MTDEDLLPPVAKPKPLADAARRLKLGLPAPKVKDTRSRVERRKPVAVMTKPMRPAVMVKGSPESVQYMRDLGRWSKAKPKVGPPDIIEFCEGAEYLGLRLSPAQRIILKLIFGDALAPEEMPLFRQITGRTRDPRRRFRVATIAAGARGGKTGFIMAPALLHHALYGEHKPAVGEVIRIALVAQDAEAASVCFDYLVGYMERPGLKGKVVGTPRRRRMVVRNKAGYDVEIRTFPCTAKAARSYSFAAAGLDEVAFWKYQVGAAAQDVEVEASIRRGMLTVKDPVLIKVSTPFAKEGILFRDVREYFGRDDSDDVLVARAPSGVLNPQISPDRLAEEQRIMEPELFAREYQAEFVDPAAAWLPNALIESAVDPGVTERPWFADNQHVMGLDPSGGGKCGFACVIGHQETADGKRVYVQDIARAWNKPKDGALDLRAVVKEVFELAQKWGIAKAFSDKYAGEWPRAWMREVSGGALEIVDPELAKPDGSLLYLTKSAAFVEVAPHFRTGSMRILDDETTLRELRNLEVRPQQGGKLYVGKPRSRDLTDDLANALALSAAMAMAPREEGFVMMSVSKSWNPPTERTASGIAVAEHGDQTTRHPHERTERPAPDRMSKEKRAAWRRAWSGR